MQNKTKNVPDTPVDKNFLRVSGKIWKTIAYEFSSGCSFISSCRKLIHDTPIYGALRERKYFTYKDDCKTDLCEIRIQMTKSSPHVNERLEYVETILKMFYQNDKLTSTQYRTFKGEIKKANTSSFYRWCEKQGYDIASMVKTYRTRQYNRINIELSMLEESPEISAAMDMIRKYPELSKLQIVRPISGRRGGRKQ